MKEFRLYLTQKELDLAVRIFRHVKKECRDTTSNVPVRTLALGWLETESDALAVKFIAAGATDQDKTEHAGS